MATRDPGKKPSVARNKPATRGKKLAARKPAPARKPAAPAKKAKQAKPLAQRVKMTPMGGPPPAPSVPPAPPSPGPARRAEALRTRWAKELISLGTTLLSEGEVAIFEKPDPTTPPTWLLVTRGLEARGLELSLRTPRTREELHAPPWAVALVQSIATTAKTEQLTDNQSLVLGAPIAPGTELMAVAFTRDPRLAPITSAWDSLPILTVVGLTRDEERLVREWSPRGLLEVLSVADPLLQTDLERASMLMSPRARAAIEQRVAKEGSSLQALNASVSELSGSAEARLWRLSADAVETLVALLKGRTGHQRPFAVYGATTVTVAPGDFAGLVEVEGKPTLKLSQQAARQIRATLKAKPGRYTFDMIPAFTLEVV